MNDFNAVFCVCVAVVTGASQRVGTVGDEGAGGSGDHSLPHADHRAEAAVGHRPAGSPVLRLRADDARRVPLARALRRSGHHVYRQPALLPQ